jgi:hypothetical protein
MKERQERGRGRGRERWNCFWEDIDLCWNRAADAQRARHTPQAVGPPHTSPNTQQRVLGLLGRHSPQKASPLGGCSLNLINHACPPTTHNVGLFPTISPSHIGSRLVWECTEPTWALIPNVGTGPPTHSVPATHPRPSGRHTRARTRSSGF